MSTIHTPFKADIVTYFATQDSEFFFACQQKYGAGPWGEAVSHAATYSIESISDNYTTDIENNELREHAQKLDKVFLDSLAELEVLNQEIANLKFKEQELRKRIFGACFENPVEGANNFALPAGYTLKFTHKINRTVDASVLPIIREELAEHKVNMDDVIRLKPELSVGTYKKLSPEARLVMDKAVTSKPGTPSYEIVAPKAKK